MNETLPLRDSSFAYGRISRLLHWTIAALVLLQFTGMGLKLWLGRESELAGFMVGLHQPTGTILFVLIVIRVIWALLNRANRPHHGGGAFGLAASAGHFLLYVMMVFVPFAALARAWGSDRGFAPFGFQIFAPQTQEVAWTQAIGGWHGEVAWVFGLVILGHILMVGVHETMWRDGTLAKMAGRLRRNPA